MAKKPAAGGHTVSYCTKCKDDLGHTILAMSGEKIVKVKCKTCGGEHKYRDRSKMAPAARRRTAASKKAVTPEEQEKLWAKAMEKGKGRDIPYNMAGSFETSDIITHEIFGRGVVLTVSEKKMTISFRDKERILVSSN